MLRTFRQWRGCILGSLTVYFTFFCILFIFWHTKLPQNLHRQGEYPKLMEWGREKVIKHGPKPFLFRNGSYNYFLPSFVLADEPVKTMIESKATFCEGRFNGYANLFANISSILLDPSKGTGKLGGESIQSVVDQAEELEYMSLSKGYFTLQCDPFTYEFNNSDPQPLRNWFEAISFNKKSAMQPQKVVHDVTIAMTRYEYVNLYHTMTDYYNAFLAALVFKLNPARTNILWIDGHPKGSLDFVWKTLFGKVVRAGRLKELVLFKSLIWNPIGYASPLNNHVLPEVPYLEEFRHFFLTRHKIFSINRKLDCSNLTVLFIWRRDYVAHPRNPEGHVVRKIKNERELVSAVQNALPGHVVKGIQIDRYPMKRQLNWISKTDILIGMHGAGLSHTLFLQAHAGLIEFYPNYWGSSNIHFRAMANWRNLHYMFWENSDYRLELPDGYTIIPEDIISNMVLEMKTAMCNKGNR